MATMTEAEARAFVEFRVFKQRVDEGDQTTYEVVDRFRSGQRIVASFKTEEEADLHRDAIRGQRLRMMETK